MSVFQKLCNIVKKEYSNYLDSVDKKKENPTRYSFIMHDDEKEFFTQNIQDSENYLEFGVGGSTFHVIKNSKANIYSIDSSKSWLENIESFKLIKKMKESDRLKLFLVDIGPTKSWGFPLETNDKELFPAFSSYIFSQINPDMIDTILVDGRFRVACTLKSILECGKNPNLKIMIHDFTFRSGYEHVFNYLDEIKRVNSLVLFKIKPGIDVEKLKADYDYYKYIPD